MTTATRFPVEGAHMTDRARRLDEPQWLHRHLRAVVLLAGSIRPSEMFRAVGCSPLHLPVDQTHTLIHWWHDQIEALVERLGLARIVTKVMVDRQSRPPTTANLNGRVLTSVKTDPSEYRGTASLLKDVADTYADDDLLLVASAFQLLTQPLADLTIQIAGPHSDVSILGHSDGTPSGLMLIRCGALRGLRSHGFMDLKEQALSQIAADHDVRVIRRNDVTALPIRTRADYIEALRRYHEHCILGRSNDAARRERWEPVFSIGQTGAVVHRTAYLHDSVVLPGARVGRDAVVIRSVVCSGGVVKRRAQVKDQTIGSGA